MLALPGTALAQESEPVLEEIMVIGSHIRRNTYNSSSPISLINSEAIQGVGTVNVGELLSRVPAITGSVTGTSANVNDPQSSGISTVALRNLGSSRTLTLVNGRRYVSGVSAGAGYGVDLNSIPTTMIERIEVLTGAQSAAYGSDAVAGVINVITKTDFEGVQLNSQYGESEQGGRERRDIDLTLGKNFEAGNAWFSLGYSDDDGLQSSDRDHSRYSQRSIDTDSDGLHDGLAFEGSSFIPGSRLIGGGLSIKGDGSPFNGGRDLATTDRLNFNEFRSMLIPLERKFAAGGMILDLSEKARVSFEMNYAQVESRARFEPIPLSISNDVYKVSRGGSSGMNLATHPLWVGSSAGNQLVAAGVTSLDGVSTFRRTVELGGRGSGNERTTFRTAIVLDYDFDNGMYLNTYATYGITEQQQTDFGDINLERAAYGLDFESDGAGGYQCANEVARINGCVPYNPFNTVDSLAGQAGIVDISVAAVDYLQAAVGLEGEVEQVVVASVLAGDLPFSLDAGEASFALGAEYREEKGSETPDGLRQKGITRGYNIQPTDGAFEVWEVFAEVHIPLLEQLNLDAALRIGDYSSVGSATTWKLGLDAPISDSIRLRSAFSTAVRAPNISDLFAGAVANAAIQSDPCNGVDASTSGNVAVNCRSIGAIQNRINATGAFTLTQVESQNTTSFNKGSENLEEETADSITLGIVLTPTSLPGLSAALDYYAIEIEDAIRIPTGTTIMNRCHEVDSSAFDASCGGLLFRDPNVGPVLDVLATANNEDTIETSGIDVEVSYYFEELGSGSLNLSLTANYLNQYKVTGAGGDEQDLQGELLFPKIRYSLNMSWDINNFNVFTQIRYWDATKDRNDDNPHNSRLNNIGEVYHVDMRGSYQISDTIKLYIGANNLLDEGVEEMGFTHKYSQQGTNTNGTVFDVVGRQWYGGVRIAF